MPHVYKPGIIAKHQTIYKKPRYRPAMNRGPG